MRHGEAREPRRCFITVVSSVIKATRRKQIALVKMMTKPYSFCMFFFFFKKLRQDFVQVDEDGKAVLLDLRDHGTGEKGKGSLKKSSQGKEGKKGRKW